VRRQSLRPIARRALATQSDERLVGLVRDGHEPAFEEIVRRYRGPLVAFATAIVSHHRAEDVVQGALTKAHSALLGVPREIALRPWLFTIVRNASLNVIRDEHQMDELPVNYPITGNPASIAEQHEELDRLVLAICALPSGQREALVRRELEGVGHADIAAQLGTSATAVRGLIFRARTSLRDAVGALVPLPLLRQLMVDGPRAGNAAEAASGGAGIGAAVIGVAGAKGGVAVTAAVLALATGVAIERHRGDHGEQASAQVRNPDIRTDSTASVGGAGGAGASTGVAAPAGSAGTDGLLLRSASKGSGSIGGGPSFVPNVTSPSGSDSASSVDDSGSGSGSGSGDDGNDGSGSIDSSGPGSGTSDARDEGTSGNGAPLQPPPVRPDDGGGPGPSGSGGPGSGGSGSDDPAAPPPSGSGSSGSGGPRSSGSGSSGSSGSGSSGSGSGGSVLLPISQQPPPPPSDDGGGGHPGDGGGGETIATITGG
jgi:RNA polymerase sigma factor (sigma-70 family)